MSVNGRLLSLRRQNVISLARWDASQSQRRHLNHFIPRTAPAATTENVASGHLQDTFTLAIKDNIATTTHPTTCGSSMLATHRSPFEATIVTQLRARGAVIVGKTNLDEFGMGSHSTNSAFGPVGGDDHGRRSAGGSSGGSAVAVARGEADVALGTDTGGSVRLPAAYTGIAGFKPSYGMLSRHGVVPYANSLDTVGLLARGVGRITELVLGTGLWAEHDAQDPTSLSREARARCARAREGFPPAAGDRRQGVAAEVEWSLEGLVFGLPLEYNIAELEPCVRDAWAAAVRTAQEKGAQVVPVSLPSTRHALSAYYVIAPAEASSNLAKYDGVRYGTRGTESDGAGEVLYSQTRGRGFGDEVKRRILLGSYTLSSKAMDNYFIQAQKVRRLVRRDFDRVFRLQNPLYEPETFDLSDIDDEVRLENKLGPTQVDFLLCPTAPTLPPTLEEVMRQTPIDAYMNDVFTVPASLAGLPAISIPMMAAPDQSQGEHAPPFAGLQLIGQYWDDARLLGVAGTLARAVY